MSARRGLIVTTRVTDYESLAFAGRIRMFTEKARIACQNHQQQKPDDELANEIMGLVLQQEAIVEHAMQEFMRTNQVWLTWAQHVRDLGPMGLSALMSRCDIYRLETISQMWAHLGFAPGQRLVRGEKATFDVMGRVLAYRVGQRFIRTRKPGKFNPEYYKRKEYEIARIKAAGGSVKPGKRGGPDIDPPDMSAGQVNARSMRYMIKIFLACLWLVWRQAEGLAVREPYTEQYPGSDGRLHRGYRPEEFIEGAVTSADESHLEEVFPERIEEEEDE